MSPSGFSSGGSSSSGLGGCLATGLVGIGSLVGVANASWTGPRASTSTPLGTGGGSAAGAAACCSVGASWPRLKACKPTPTPVRQITAQILMYRASITMASPHWPRLKPGYAEQGRPIAGRFSCVEGKALRAFAAEENKGEEAWDEAGKIRLPGRPDGASLRLTN